MRLLRRRRRAWPASRPDINDGWSWLGHVDPPPDTVDPTGGPDHPGLFHYIGPRLFPLGVYMPKGYDLEMREGDTPEWTVLRARCLATGQVMTMWALQHEMQEDSNGNLVPTTVGMTLLERDWNGSTF